MKVTNITANNTIYLKDLRLIRESQGSAQRAEDQYIKPGHSVYLPDTSDVLRSAQKGDLRKFELAGKLRLNDITTLTAAPGPGSSITITHNLNYPPIVTVLKKVVVGPVTTWVDASGIVDVTHDATFQTVTIANTVALPIDFQIRIG